MIPLASDAIASAVHWAEYETANFGEEISLVWEGKLPRQVIMKEAGDLRCNTRAGDDGTLTGLPQWHVHNGQPSSLRPEHSAAIIVLW